MLAKNMLRETALAERPIEVELERRTNGPSIVVIRDRFEGMSSDTMRTKLLRYGARSSGFTAEGSTRGINSRGAKDVAELGPLTISSVCDGRVSMCRIIRGQMQGPVERPATPSLRAEIGIPDGNGTVASLELMPGQITIPLHDNLAADLNRHIEIRTLLSRKPRVRIQLRERFRPGKFGRVAEIVGFSPEGELRKDIEESVPGYEGYGKARLRLYVSKTDMTLPRTTLSRLWESEAGILVEDGHTAHDIGFLGLSVAGDPAAKRVFGILSLPQVPRLLQEYDDFEDRQRTDPAVTPPATNPAQVTDPDRLGLNLEHPFIRGALDFARPHLQDLLAEVGKEITPVAEERLSAELREALRRLGEELARQLSESSVDIGIVPWGLSVIPSHRRLELGQTKALAVYYRTNPGGSTATVPATAVSSSPAVKVLSGAVVLEAMRESPGTFRGYVRVTGVQLTDPVGITITAQGQTRDAYVSVREPTKPSPRVLESDIEFEQPRYVIAPKKNRVVRLLSTPELVGSAVVFSLDPDETSVELGAASTELSLDSETGFGVAQVRITASDECSVSLVAQVKQTEALADIEVRESSPAPRIEFKLADVTDFNGRRFKWNKEASRFDIAADHRSLSRVLGPKDQSWPGQTSPQARATIAEIIADAVASRRLEAALESGDLAYDDNGCVDPVDYTNYRVRFLEAALRACHDILVQPYAP